MQIECVYKDSRKRFEMDGPGAGYFCHVYYLFDKKIVSFQPQTEKLLPQINEPSSATKSPYIASQKPGPKRAEDSP